MLDSKTGSSRACLTAEWLMLAQATHRLPTAWHAAVKHAGTRALALHRLARHISQTHQSLAPIRQRQGAAAAVRAVVAGSVGVPAGLAAGIARRAGGLGPGAASARGAAAWAVPGAGFASWLGGVAPRDLLRVARQGATQPMGLAPARGTRDAARVARALRSRGVSVPALAAKFRATPALPSIAPRGLAGPAGAASVPRHAAVASVAPVPAGTAHGTNAGWLPGRTAGRDRAPAGGTPAEATAAETARQRRDVAAALETYFLRQARLPPSSGAAFDPRLTPAWAGLQLPG